MTEIEATALMHRYARSLMAYNVGYRYDLGRTLLKRVCTIINFNAERYFRIPGTTRMFYSDKLFEGTRDVFFVYASILDLSMQHVTMGHRSRVTAVRPAGYHDDACVRDGEHHSDACAKFFQYGPLQEYNLT